MFHLWDWEDVHEFLHEEVVVAVIGAEVRPQQRDVLSSAFPFLPLGGKVRQHVNVFLDSVVDRL